MRLAKGDIDYERCYNYKGLKKTKQIKYMQVYNLQGAAGGKINVDSCANNM